MTAMALNDLYWRLQHVTPQKVAYTLGKAWFSGLFYGETLRRRHLGGMLVTGGGPWPGDAARGALLLRGPFGFAPEAAAAAEDGEDAGEAAGLRQAALHGFAWLKDVQAVGGEAARGEARRLVDEWIERHGRWRPFPWRPDILGQRISSWLTSAEFLLNGSDDRFRARFIDSLLRQTRHLGRVATLAAPGAERLLILKAQIHAALCLPPERRRIARCVARLEREVAAQFHPDGGHVSRSPGVHYQALKSLVEVRLLLNEAQVEMPAFLTSALERAAPMLRYFRHGDGGLALFNDTNEEDGWLIELVLAKSDVKARPPREAPDSGFMRLAANRTLVIMDAGAPPRPPLDAHAHAGTLSFELSCGKERIIVNAGAHAGGVADWAMAQRTTAAHSTAAVDDCNSSYLLGGALIGHRPKVVTAERQESDGNIWVEASHDGYVRDMGLVHRRRLWLAANGGDLRGEDTLVGDRQHKFAVRFHLHPSVKVSKVQDGSSILLRTPGGIGWRMRSAGGVVDIQDGIYLGVKGEAKRTSQIVISGATQPPSTQIKWAFSRLNG
ncbi:MAG: heparinase II/III family protein [Rhodospirillales bacterium]